MNLILIHSQILFHRWLWIFPTSETHHKPRHQTNGVKTLCEPRWWERVEEWFTARSFSVEPSWRKTKQKKSLRSLFPAGAHTTSPTKKSQHVGLYQTSAAALSKALTSPLPPSEHFIMCLPAVHPLDIFTLRHHRSINTHTGFFLLICHSFTTMTCCEHLSFFVFYTEKPQNPFRWQSHLSCSNLWTFPSLLISNSNWIK